MRLNLRDHSTQKWALAIGLVFAAIYGYINFMYVPRRDFALQLSQEIDRETQLLAKGKRIAANYQTVQEDYRRLLDSWEVAQQLLPTQKEMEALLKAVALEGQRHRVEFLLFRPTAAVEQPYYWENSIEIKTLSSYHDLGKFLSAVGALDRIVNIKNLRMTAYRPNRGRSPSTVEADFVATIYVFKDLGAPIVPATATETPAASGRNRRGRG